MSRKLIPVFLFIFILSSNACSSNDDQVMVEGGGDMAITVKSSAFTDGEMIPKKYTCDGDNISPPLSWSGLPEGTESLALVLNDPDAPAGDWVHWVLYNIPATQSSLPEGAKGFGDEGKNTYGNIGYGGPCPPKGSAHRYFFKIYALTTILELDSGETRESLERVMEGNILAQGQLMGKYQR